LVWVLRASSQLFTFFRNAMASSKTLEQAIADITIWRKGEQRAPHKPLLLLYVLANYQQGHARLFDYGTEVAISCLACWNALAHSGRHITQICPSGDSKGMVLGSSEH
jgi:predicted restriction endonuclease